MENIKVTFKTSDGDDEMILKATAMVTGVLTSDDMANAPMKSMIIKNIETILKQACTLQQSRFEELVSIVKL